jgi:hypothetical protein
MHARTTSILLVTLVVAFAGAAHAQAPDRDRARELAREAAELFQAGNRRAAVAKFEEAYRLFPTPALLYNIGKAYAGLSDHVRAHRALSQFLRETDASETDLDRRAEAQTLLADLAPHVGVATITAPAFPGATLELDGVALGTAPLPAPLAVSPGVHEITARDAGVLVARKRVTIAGGGRPDIELTRVEDDLEKVFITKEVPSRPVYKRWWFWTAIGATVASSAALYIATNPRQVNDVDSPPLGNLGLDDFTRR